MEMPAGPAGRGTPGLIERLARGFSSIAYLEIGADGAVLHANETFCRRVGVAREEVEEREVATLLTAPDARTVLAWAAGAAPPADAVLLNFVGPEDAPFTLRCVVGRRGDRLVVVGEPDWEGEHAAAEKLLRLNNAFATMARELARKTRELERARAELATTLAELKASHWHLQKIQEVLPVCMACGKVKGVAARWESVAEYLRSNEILVSHGFCPECHAAAMRAWRTEADA
jgi:PAS domain-containing protein